MVKRLKMIIYGTALITGQTRKGDIYTAEELRRAAHSPHRRSHRIAREVAYEVIDEHLEEYEHKEKQPQPFEIESGEDKPDG